MNEKKEILEDCGMTMEDLLNDYDPFMDRCDLDDVVEPFNFGGDKQEVTV